MPRVGDKEAASKWHVVLAGSMAGLFSRFVIAPLDVVKIRLQLQPHGYGKSLPGLSPVAPIYKGILPTMRTIVVQEGIRGLWKGNIPAELLYLSYGAVQFLAYREFNVMISTVHMDVSDPVRFFIAGAAAGGVATSVTYPLDLLRTRFAAQGGEKVYESLMHSVRLIATTEGTRGYFRGVDAAVSQIVPYMGLFFGTYETTRTYLAETQHIPVGWSDAISGSFAAGLGKTGVFPLDLIRKRLQVQGPTREKYVHRNIPVYSSVFGAAKSIIHQEGLRGLYKGLTVSLIKAAPLSALTMWSFERSLNLLEWVDPRKDEDS